MSKFVVKTPILRNGKLFRPGEEIELSKEEAGSMDWAVHPLGAVNPEKRTLSAAEKAEDAARDKAAQLEREAANRFKAAQLDQGVKR